MLTYYGHHFMIYVKQTIMLYPLNLYSGACQLFHNKTGGGGEEKKEKSSPLVFPPCFKRISAASAAGCQEWWPGAQALGKEHSSASVQPRASAFMALSLSFPVYEMGMTTGPTTWGHGVDEMKSRLDDSGWQNNGP